MRTRYLLLLFLLPAGWLRADTVQYAYDAAGRLTSATYSNGTTIAYTYDKAGNLLKRSITSPQSSGPQISAGGIVNAASFRAPLARGSLATIFGSNLAGGIAQADQLPLKTTLGGVQVSVAGQQGRLIYVSPTQINFQVPFEAPASGNVAVVVTRDGTPSAPQNVTMAEYAPGIFTYARNATTLDPVILHGGDNTLVTPSSPATANEVLVIYATGAGSFDHPPATGEAAGDSPVAKTLVTPTAKIGGASAQVQFSGLTPGFAGLLQVNIQLPPTLPAGSSLPLVLAFGSSQAPVVNLSVK